ncbi:MAG: hypothetical protein U0W40_20685 [Acidimicrobiia bacterium]
MHPVLGSFVDDVIRELVAALGAALFFANLWALIKRSSDADRVSARTVERSRPGSPVRSVAKPAPKKELAQAPVFRTVLYMVIGFFVMIAGLAARFG